VAYRNAFLWFFLALFVIGAGIYPMRSFLGHVDTAALQSFPAQDSVHIAFNHWLPSAVKNYAAHGTFDAQDLLAGALGCLIAGLMSLRLLTK